MIARRRGWWMAVAASLAAALPAVSRASAQEAATLPPAPLGLERYMRIPESNPLTPGKIALGRRLFFDPALSRDRSVSCASCHRPEHGFADPVPRSTGVGGRRPARHTPGLLNAGYRTAFFWDGRADTLEEQVVQPISHPDEMGLPLDEAVARLAADPAYRGAFQRAFGEPVSAEALARALASYVRSLRSGDSPVDRYAAGDHRALGPAARRGYAVFLGPGRCAGCHGGPLFSDGRFHNTGVGWGGGDPGRAQVTGRDGDLGAFRTPSLRAVARTAPYMHDGSIATLEDVVEFYDGGGRDNPYLDRDLRPLGLSARQKADLVAFLRALEGRGGGR